MTAKLVQTRFELAIFSIHFDLHVFSNSDAAHLFAGFFVLAQAHKNRRAELSIAGPFREFDFAYEDRIYPMHFAHHRWRDSLHPFSILLRRKIDKRAIVALFLSEFIMQHLQ